MPLLLITACLGGCANHIAPGAVGLPFDRGATFRIVTFDFNALRSGDGSGFFVRSDGLAVTCRHVIMNVEPIGIILVGGRRARFEVVTDDAEADLALIRVEGSGFPFLVLADREAHPGERVWTATKYGTSRGRIREEIIDPDVGRAIEFSSTLRPGGSGGALVAADGEVLGVIRGAIDDDPAQTVAVPVARLKALIARAP